MKQSDFFVTGGALLADAGCYVARAADTDLAAALRAGEFCYVLTTRQMGKTSLMVRTAAQLRQEGRSVVVLDLTAFGQNLSVEQWYFSMLSDMAGKLDLEHEMEAYWEANLRRSPLHRFMGAILDVYLETKPKPLTVFVDEIDVVRSLRQFKADEFFAGIREFYNRRGEDPRLQRLAFCLLGVATPSDLISDQRMTPFNVGRGIELADFTRDEAEVLAAGLAPYRETALALLDRALFWTGGHPYLTQRLCAELAKAGAHKTAAVDDICTGVFLSADASSRDENLQFVRERLLRSELDPAALLDCYARVCRGERLVFDDHNALHNELRLSGIVRVVNGNLQQRNRIYSRVFDLKWVRANLPEAEDKRQRAAFWRGVRRVAGAAAVGLAIVVGLAFQARRNAAVAQAASQTERKAAQRERRAAEREKNAADGEKQAAALARAAADGERKANEDRLAQVEQTELALKRLVDTQSKVATLLEALTPLVGQKSGKGILDRAEELVAGLSSEARDDPRIRIGLADLRRVCGRLYLRLGNEAKALEQAEAARQIVQAELARKPAANAAPWNLDSGALKKLLYETHLLVGDVIRGDRAPPPANRKPASEYERATKAYEQAAQLARSESEANPADAIWRQLYFDSRMTIADTTWLCGRADDAEKRLVEAIAELGALREKQPAALDIGWIEASFYDRLGTLHLARDRPAKAREEFDRGLGLREAGATDGAPEDPERLSDMAQSFNTLGNLALREKDYKTAITYYQRSLAIRRKLCEQSPRLDWARNLGYSLSNVAQALWKDGQTQAAHQYSSERLKLAEGLLNQDPSDANLHSEYANALFNSADILLNGKDPAVQDWSAALELARYAVARTERRDPRLLALLAQALRLNKLPVEALATVEEAAKLLPPPEKRTGKDTATAEEIDFELRRSKAAASARPNAKPQKPPKQAP